MGSVLLERKSFFSGDFEAGLLFGKLNYDPSETSSITDQVSSRLTQYFLASCVNFDAITSPVHVDLREGERWEVRSGIYIFIFSFTT